MTQTFTIPDLIDKFAEFFLLCPDSRSWDEETLRGNGPRYYRFMQVDALRKAFSVDSFKGLNHFPKDELSEEECLIRENYILDKVIDFGTRSGEYSETESDVSLTFVWHLLMKVRIDLQRVIEGPHYIEFPAIGRNIFTFLEERKTPVLKFKDEINEILSFMISPVPLTVSIETLLKEYNYPDVDLEEIDLESI